MPIRGLTDRSAEPPRLGIIRKGDPKQQRTKDGKTYEVVGHDRDSFRVVFDSQYKPFEPIFTDMYGETPVEFRNLMLLGDTPDTILQAWLEERTQTKLLHRCDGDTQETRFVDGEYVHDNAPCVKKAGGKCNCTERASLRVVMMDFTLEAGVWGYFKVETGSLYDIINLNNCLQFINGFQDLRGLRWVLGRSPKTVSVPAPKNPAERMRVEKNLLYLMVEPEQTKQFLVANMNQRDRLMLTGAVDRSTGELTALPASTAPTTDGTLETDLEPELGYDMDELVSATVHLFDHDQHQANTIAKLQASGKLTDDMDTAQAVMAVTQDRIDRRNEKFADGSWWKETDLVKSFCAAVQNVYPRITASEILQALNMENPFGKKSKMSQFTMPREKAWALVLINQEQGNYDAARARASDSEIIQWIDDIEMDAVGGHITEQGDVQF